MASRLAKCVFATTDDLQQSSKARQKNLGTYNPNQELEFFANWTSESIWVPPKNNSAQLAQSMLSRFSPFAAKKDCWNAIVDEHRSKFTQVREIELPKASIRLPQGRLYVTVTQRKHFDKIEDQVPDCVQTRLDEFLQSREAMRGAKVYYLKPLCIESDDQLIFTTKAQLEAAIEQIQEEVFAEYRRMYLGHRAKQLASATVNAGLAIPRSIIQRFLNRKKREIEAYHAKLEFERRKRAWRATKAHRKLRTTGCRFEEMLALMDPPDRQEVIDHYVQQKELSRVNRQMFLLASAAALPWFATLSVGVIKAIAVSAAVSVAVCDPAFVAELPGRDGTLYKIGHFDEIDGVMHVEI